ncbi:hypothetical protein VNO77_04198 [Canavalia gladiata]|uniref:Uncharacterized protein n=1 Tax=Canavalia gladiata TaxID=3824 RepID=A0AAN9N186_CANGL
MMWVSWPGWHAMSGLILDGLWLLWWLAAHLGAFAHSSENDGNELDLVSTSLGANPSLSQQLHWPRRLQHVRPSPYIWAYGVMAIGANLGPEMTRPKHGLQIHVKVHVKEPDSELEITTSALFLDRLCKLFCIVNSLEFWLIWSTMDKCILSQLIVSNPPICSHFFWNIQILCSTGEFFSIGLSALVQYDQQPY